MEVGRSRDSWASHTTLQNSSIQRLQEENGQLRAGKVFAVCSLFLRHLLSQYLQLQYYSLTIMDE